jgi:tetratricopeptide (TPR) repeat protein
LLSSD